MHRLVVILMISTMFAVPIQAADKIPISMTGFAGQFMTYPLAQKRGFLKEGFEAEVLRIAAAAGRAALRIAILIIPPASAAQQIATCAAIVTGQCSFCANGSS